MSEHHRKTKTRVSDRQALKAIAIRLTQEPIVIPDSSIPRKPMMDVLADHFEEQEIQAIWDRMAQPDMPDSRKAMELRLLDTDIMHGMDVDEAGKRAVRNYRKALERYRLFPAARVVLKKMAEAVPEETKMEKFFGALIDEQLGDRLAQIVPDCVKRLNRIVRLEKELLATNADPELKKFTRGVEYFIEQHRTPSSLDAVLEAGGMPGALSREAESSLMLDSAERDFHSQSNLKFAEKALHELKDVSELLQRGHFL